MLLLDTDILIDFQRKHVPAVNWFAGLTELPQVPGFVVMELIQDAESRHQVQAAIKLVAPFRIVWPTELDCERALGYFTAFHVSNGLGLLDAMIAACAIGLAAKLCTFNRKHYLAVPNLLIEQPYLR